MPAFLGISCDVSQAEIKAFTDALDRYAKETSRSMKDAVRSATIDLVKSLRARTRRSRKVVERSDVSKSYLPPKWIMRGHGGKPRRRMQILRWGHGTNRLDHRYVPGGEYVRGPKGGQRLRPFSDAQLRREAQQSFGQIRNWGLAKKSWGWFMKSLFNKSVQDENPKAIIKMGMVGRDVVDTKNEYSITIVNKLDYIRKAMPSGVLSLALQKAANLINHKISSGLRSRRFKA